MYGRVWEEGGQGNSLYSSVSRLPGRYVLMIVDIASADMSGVCEHIGVYAECMVVPTLTV